MILRVVLIVTFLLSSVQVLACDEQDAKLILSQYQWLTEDYPPYNYQNEHGELIGISTEILFAVYHQLDIELPKKNITLVPWARLYHNLENYPEYAGFSMVNTPERNTKFKLVAMPIPSKTSIMIMADKKLLLEKKPLEKLIIGVVREDIGQQLLNMRNIPAKQVVTSSASNMIQMLINNRVDAIAYTEDVALFQYNKLEVKKGHIVPLYLLDEDSFNNYVFYKNTPACVINLFTKTLAILNKQGILIKIINKYLPPLPIQASNISGTSS